MAKRHIAGGLAAAALLTGCALNSTVAVSPDHPAPIPRRAVVVFAVAAESLPPQNLNAVQLDQYDLVKQQITGGCFLFERVIGEIIPTNPGQKRYFVFAAAPGAYTFSRFNNAVLDGPSRAFIAPSGQVTYIGDFTYRDPQSVRRGRRDDTPIRPDDRRITLTMDLVTAEKVTGATMVPAKVVDVAPPRAFVCTP
jgi:hypothetical protein